MIMLRLAVSLSLACCLVLPPTTVRGQTPGKKYALLVGVTDYDHASLARLRYTENDIEGLAALLTRPSAGFASMRVLTSTRGKKRPADAPTAEHVRAAIKALLAGKKRDDTVLVALAGHGIQARVGDSDESFFCPSDAQLNDNSTLINMGGLMKDLGACGAAVKLLLVDACRNDPALGRNVDVDTLPRPPRGLGVLFSCKSGERAFESPKLGKGHGVFFHHILEGLKGKAATEDREVTWDSLGAYVRRAVSRQVPGLIGGGARQTPHAITNIEGEPPVLLTLGKDGGSKAKPDAPRRTYPLSATGGGYKVAVNRTGEVTATKGGVMVWKVDRRKRAPAGTPVETVHDVLIHGGGVFIAQGNAVRMYQLTTGKEQRILAGMSIPDGATVTLSVEDGNLVVKVGDTKHVWDLRTGRKLSTSR
jgi:hypothetical protein